MINMLYVKTVRRAVGILAAVLAAMFPLQGAAETGTFSFYFTPEAANNSRVEYAGSKATFSINGTETALPLSSNSTSIRSVSATSSDNSQSVTMTFSTNAAIYKGTNWSQRYGFRISSGGTTTTTMTFKSSDPQAPIKAIRMKGTQYSSDKIDNSSKLPSAPSGLTWISDNASQPTFTLTLSEPAQEVTLQSSSQAYLQQLDVDLDVPFASPELLTYDERGSADEYIINSVGLTPYFVDNTLHHVSPQAIVALRIPDGCATKTYSVLQQNGTQTVTQSLERPVVYYTVDGTDPDTDSPEGGAVNYSRYLSSDGILYFHIPELDPEKEYTFKARCQSKGGELGAVTEFKVRRLTADPAQEIVFDQSEGKVNKNGSVYEYITLSAAELRRPESAGNGNISWMFYNQDLGQAAATRGLQNGQYTTEKSTRIWMATDAAKLPQGNTSSVKFTKTNDGIDFDSERTVYLHYWNEAADYVPAGFSSSLVKTSVVVVPIKGYAPVEVDDISDLIARSGLAEGDERRIADGTMVRFSRQLTVTGVHTTALNSSFMYGWDGSSYLKLIARGSGDNHFAADYYGTRVAGADDAASLRKVIPAGLAGYWSENDGMYQLMIKDVGYDLRSFMPDAVSDESEAYRPADVTQLTMDLFNSHVELRDAVGTSRGTVMDHAGNEIDVTLRFNDITEGQPETAGAPYCGWGYSVSTPITEGRRYRIRGYAGNTLNTGQGAASARMAIFPENITAEYPGPEVQFAYGNRIEPGDIRIINPDINLKPYVSDQEVDRQAAFEYSTSADGGTTWSGWTAMPADMLTVTVESGTPYTVRFRASYGDGIYGWNIPAYTFTLFSADDTGSIADFKEAFLNDAGDVDAAKFAAGKDAFRRMTGQAVVEERTEYYLYLRDNTPDAGSRNHILVYNANGWSNAPTVNDGASTRSLEAGDVITRFAMIPDLTPQGNLRLNATGYARTFEVVSGAAPEPSTRHDITLTGTAPEDENEWVDDDNYYKKVNIARQENRMLHFRISNVRIASRHNPQWDEVAGSEDADGVRRDAEGFVVDPEVYTLMMGDADNDAVGDGRLDIRFNVFTSRRQGFTTSYSPDASYVVEGVVVRDAQSDRSSRFSPSGFSIALLDARLADTALKPEAVMFDGVDVAEGSPFDVLHTGVVTIRLSDQANSQARVYYTLDGSDPLTNTARQLYDPAKGIQLPVDASVITLRAYAVWPGANPSEVVERTFRRESRTVEYIRELVGPSAEEGVPYSFNGLVRVVATGGDYMFVRGLVGHYLPIHRVGNAGESAWQGYAPGQYLTTFVSEVEKVGEGESRTVRGVHVTDAMAPFMGAPSDDAPQQISIEPDVITTVTDANVRRLVTLTGVTLKGEEFEVDDTDAQAIVTQWQLTEDRGHGKQVFVNNSVLEFDMSDAGKTEYSTSLFNVTGFVMLSAEGELELWPIKVDRLDAVKAPEVTLEGGDAVMSDGGLGLTVATFYPSTDVTLTYTGRYPDDVTIYYVFTPDESAPADDVKWNVYGQPFTVASDAYLHAYATVPGLEASAHTHVQFVRDLPAGHIDFKVTPGNGSVTVALVPAGDLGDDDYTILYNIDGSKPSTVYTDAFILTASATVYAVLSRGGHHGTVERAYIAVPEAVTPDLPAADDRISGGVTYRIVEAADGSLLVELIPVDELAAGSYTIRYATEAGKTPDAVYSDPFPIPESGLVVARLEEDGKVAGQIHTLNVWMLTPSAIDSVGADAAAGVKVEGSAIIAPAGSEVYDLTGRRVATSGLGRGVYIVRLADGTAVKAIVR